ncbi:flagellar hook-basal body protein [Pseudoxanthomonas sp. SGD-10]|jgi:Flagellar hook-basal body protein|uniref:flagellar hook-basal body complex protein FliE n=1 Tax=unclassified Pseudoxanthomonas TaxID=2645906 RepID=UPI0002DE6BB0|nr:MULTISPECIES: flagellar hook-basal body complex protein FliE [unclassified Pseudoxanthomonas]RRN81046.1 flagellar hook-basal body protein [Pseudoxanthomonas sp. SGD-10]
MEALTNLPSLPPLALLQPGELPPSPPSDGASAGGFGDMFQKVLHQVDAVQHEAARQVEAVETGASDDLVGAMLASQEASLSFSMLIQVRNKVMAAFDDLMKTTV